MMNPLPRIRSLRIPTLLFAFSLLYGCADEEAEPVASSETVITAPPKIDLEPFRELARTSDCADVVNRLFLIDGHLVFWDRESRCADASYSRAFYGRTVDQLLCRAEDSIAGPRQMCDDRPRYAAMFETIMANLDKPDLGLGPRHTVKPVDF